MKARNAIIGVFATIGLLGLIGGGMFYAGKHVENAAMKTAMNSRVVASDQFLNRPDNGATYLKALKRIDVHLCPQDFQANWAEYLDIWQKNVDHPIAIVFSDLPKTSEVWKKCELTAALHGVEPSN